ncbi:MAG: CDP-glycerol glycerophosphotransferase family protein [Candidatus Marinimicrobia bacterium]|nr:CDP-glycerol glycerophosphotransferase family protein [Candidatus Neomarinimicrobiota bacterium]
MFNAVMFILSPLIYLINKIVPLSKGKVLFYSKGGLFHGDPKYFYDYLIKKKWGHPLWITNSKDVYNYLCKEYSKKNVVLRKGIIGNIKYIYHYLTSSAVIIRGRNDFWDILKFTKAKRRKVINLGHGILVPGTKKTGIEIRSSKKAIKREIKRRRAVTYYTMCSDIEKYIRSAAYHVNINNFIVTGLPRSDILINCRDKKQATVKFLIGLIEPKVNFKKVILYAPTHRDSGRWKDSVHPSAFFPFTDFEIRRLQVFLEKNNAIVLLRTHDYENKFAIKDQSQTGSIINNNRIFYFSHSVLLDVNEILPAVDLLITDYSSIAIDFLLCNKPIIYVPYDLENYHRGIILDYNRWTPGNKVLGFIDFIKAAQEYLDNPEKDSEERERLTEIFHQFRDGKSCKRIFKLIKN